MNKWIYSSVTLNLISLIGIIHTILFRIIMSLNPKAYGDPMGFYWIYANIICLIVLFVGYIIEIIIYRIKPNIVFCFPYIKIKSNLVKFFYFSIFYTGLLLGAGILILLIFFFHN